MPPKRSRPDKKDELSTLAVPVFKPITNTIISVWKWSPTMLCELVCVKVISHEQQEPIVQEKMALSRTFPLPALQSGAIASLAKWWPYAQLATRRGKWFIRPELASSHLLPSPMPKTGFFAADRGQCGHSEQLAALQPHMLQAVTLHVSRDLSIVMDFQDLSYSSPQVRCHSKGNDSTQRVWERDGVPVPGWCRRRSAGTPKPLWPASEWPARAQLSHRLPAQWLLHSYTETQ